MDKYINEIDQEYWTNKLSKNFQSTFFPTLKVDRDNQLNAREKIEQFIKREVYDEVLKLCRNSDMAIFVLFLSSLSITIKKYINEDDVIIATPPFIDKEENYVLFLKNRISDKVMLKELLNIVKESTLRDLSHQDCDIYNLYNNLRHDNKVLDLQLTNVAFAYNKLHNNYKNIQHFDINIILLVENKNAKLIVNYDAEKYTKELMSLFLDNFLYIFENLWENLNCKIEELSIISKNEKIQLLEEFNNTMVSFPQNKLLHELFEEQVMKTPEQISLVFGDYSITYNTLNIKANKLARILRKKGIGPNKVVALCYENSIEMIIGLLAILKSGGIYLPINTDYPEERIMYMLEDSGADLLIVNSTKKYLSNYQKETICINDSNITLIHECEENLDIVSTSEDIAYIIYTSGSTGMPKGVMIQHKSIVNQIFNLTLKYNFDSALNHILMSPITFDPSIQQILLPIISGGVLHIVPESLKVDIEQLWDYLLTNNINVFNTVPSLMNAMLNICNEKKNISFKYIILAGEVFQKSLYEKLKQKLNIEKLINIYGPTEATINSTIYECKKLEKYSNIPIGKPLSNYIIYILDKNLNLVPIGSPGEICISGVGVAKQYINKSILSEEKFVTNPFKEDERMYRTGDLARWLPDGNIEFIGRNDNIIKINGKKVDLGEIEKILSNLEFIKDSVVLDKKFDNDRKQLWAYIVLNADLSVEEIKEYLKLRLPAYMIPSFFVKIDSIPLTSNHKIDKYKLLENENYMISEKDYFEAKTDTEKKVHLIWKKIININHIGIRDNFFELGGNSLNVIELSREIKKEFNIEIKINDIFEKPTIESLALLIDENKNYAHETIEAIAKQEYYEISPNQQRMWVLHNLNSNMNLYGACTIKGSLKINKLENAFNNLIRRHESMRTVFINVNGETKQKIIDNLKVNISFKNLSNKNDCFSIINEEIKTLLNKPFDLEKAPLLRANLYQIEKDRYVFIIIAHHIISDGTSLKIISRDIFNIYNEGLNEEQNILKDIEIQYKDYSHWINKKIMLDKANIYEKYWLEKLSGEIPILNLDTDFKRPSIKSNIGEEIAFLINKDITNKLEYVCRLNNCTLFMGLLTTIYVLLYHYTQQEDIIIGTISAGRDQPVLENLVGYFINTLPLKIQVTQNDTFISLLKKVKTTTIEAFQYQCYPFDQLVDKLHVKRDVSRTALYDVAVNVLNIDFQEAFYKDEYLEVEAYELPIDTLYIDTDLQFDFKKQNDEIQASLMYSKDLFIKERMQLMIYRYLKIMEKTMQNTDTKIINLDFDGIDDKFLNEDIEIDFIL